MFLPLFPFIGKQSLLSAGLPMAATAIAERGWREREEKDTKKTVGKNVGYVDQNCTEFSGPSANILLKFGVYWLCRNVFFQETLEIKAESLLGM